METLLNYDFLFRFSVSPIEMHAEKENMNARINAKESEAKRWQY